MPHLRNAINLLENEHADQIVVLGDTLADPELDQVTEVAELLSGAVAVGVWGNHDIGVCRNITDEHRRLFDPIVLEFMGTLQPRIEIETCHFCHVEPWLDPEDLTDLWYFEGAPDTPEQARRSFEAVPQRFVFIGHFHKWLLVTPSERIEWDGEQAISLQQYERCLIVNAPVFQGHCALFDTESAILTPLPC